MSNKSPNTGDKKKSTPFYDTFWFLFAISVAILLLANMLLGEYQTCITDDWCLSSKDDLLLLTVFYSFYAMAIYLGLRVGLILAFGILSSKRSNLGFALVFWIIGILGAFCWIMFIPPSDRLEFIHIPIITALMMGLGFLFYFGFKPKKSKKLKWKKTNQ